MLFQGEKPLRSNEGLCVRSDIVSGLVQYRAKSLRVSFSAGECPAFLIFSVSTVWYIYSNYLKPMMTSHANIKRQTFCQN